MAEPSSPAGPDNELSESDEPESGQILCTVCLHPNTPGANYCAKCGGAINSLLTFAPYDHILLEGFAYRRAIDGPPSKIVLLGMWLLFGPIPFVALLVFVSGMSGETTAGGQELRAQAVMWSLYSILAVIILYRATANYLRKRKAQPAEEPQASAAE